MASVPLPVRLYTGLSTLVGPLAYSTVTRKLRAQGTTPDRLPERNGYATRTRPQGPLIWFHAASVGESLSVLQLISRLGECHPQLSFLLTSCTATSAKILAGRMPPRCQHQFAPLDRPSAVRRFLAHWTPDAAAFVESELWPNMLRQTGAAGVPMALLNARISDGSARNWKRAPATARHLMNQFRMIHCQDARTATHLHDLGLDHANAGHNLKSLAAPLPVDKAEEARMHTAFGARPLWLASSTHPGEDEIVIAAHQAILDQHSDALLLLVPRHPERAVDIRKLAQDAGLKIAQRSTGEPPDAATQVYLADTLGETGLWYALSPITCLCGSFTPVGGHNPFEPAQAGSALIHGPLYANFAEVYADFRAAEATCETRDATTLAAQVLTLLDDTTARHALQTRATGLVETQAEGLDTIVDDLSKALGLG